MELRHFAIQLKQGNLKMTKITNNERILLDAFGELLVSYDILSQVKAVAAALPKTGTEKFVEILNLISNNSTSLDVLLDTIEEALD